MKEKILKIIRANGGETLRYIIAGVSTTAMGLALHWLFRFCGMDTEYAKFLSMFCALMFAYFANKYYVFRRKAKNKSALALEFLSFLGGRIATLFVEYFGFIGLNLLAIKLFGEIPIEKLYNTENIANVVIQFVVFVLNYLISKLIVFRKSGNKSDSDADSGTDEL